MKHYYIDQRGRRVELGKRLGAGGEGSVFEIHQCDDHVAKIYHHPPAKEKATKLSIMGSLLSPEIQRFAAWPKSTLYERAGGPAVGIIMPKIPRTAHEVHELYSPNCRAYTFPTANWPFLIRTAHNCAAAVTTLHRNGIVIGDINQGNVFVVNDATVRLIDCDSFQVQSNGTVFKCKVGVAHFTPPELQSARFDEVLRTPNHDNFGLAILIFHLLFMGRHPFVGRYKGQGDLLIEKAIEKYYFAYSTATANSQMTPPPNSLMLSDASPEIALLFERAFCYGSANPNARPSAAEWGNALRTLETRIRKCKADDGHFHIDGQPCPWCRIVRAGGPEFFISVSIRAAVSSSETFSIAQVWARIEAVSRPNCQIHLPTINPFSLPPTPVDPDLDQHAITRRLTGTIAILALMTLPFAFAAPMISVFAVPFGFVFCVWWLVLWVTRPMFRLRRERRLAEKKARQRRDRFKEDANRVLSDHLRAFDTARASLSSAKQDLDQLAVQQSAELAKLRASARDQQLKEYLKHAFLSSAKIPGIGTALKSQLLSYGIETAWDIRPESLDQVPGFGPNRVAELLAWRSLKERQFRFNPAKGVPVAAIQSLATKFAFKRVQLQKRLASGPNELQDLSTNTQRQLQKINERIAALELAVAQAKSDLSACQ